MKIVQYSQIVDTVKTLCKSAAHNLPSDVLSRIREAHESETFPRAKKILSCIIENADIAARECIPICQDTGVAVFFVEMGDDVKIDGGLLTAAINEGTRIGYREGYLRNSIVNDPIFERKNTNDNTPAIIHVNLTSGDDLKITILPKGGGCENMSALKMLTPSSGLDGVVGFVKETVINAGGNPCPPTIVGIGIGGTADGASLLAKKALLRDVGVYNSNEKYAQLERDFLCELNASGVGPAGLGGKHTALWVSVEYMPCHIASLPVAININCHAARKQTVVL